MRPDTPTSTAGFLERLRRATPPVDEPLPRVPGVTIIEAIGRGGTGVVYRARDEASGATVAVKVLWRSGESSPDSVGRARREAEILGRLSHPNIVRILDRGECTVSPAGAASVPYLTMEWISGGTLAACDGEATLSHVEAVRIIRDVALALAEVHDVGIVHRDIKPANVLLGGDRVSGLVPKLADFGLARGDAAGERLTQDGAVLGTVGFLAPEQVGGSGDVGPACDIHGLGGTLFFLLTGRPPHEGPGTIASLVRALRGTVDWSASGISLIHPDLRTVLEKCLDPDPPARYASARDLADDLDRHLRGRPVRARRAGPGVAVIRWARRQPAVGLSLLSFAALVVALVAALAWGGVQGSRAASARHALISSERTIRASSDAARDSRELARAAMARFTDEHLAKVLARGRALDTEGARLLAELREAYLRWPAAHDGPDEAIFRAAGLRRVAAILAAVSHESEAADTYAEARGVLEAADSGDRGDTAWNALSLDALVEEYRFLVESGRAAEAQPLVDRAVALLDRPLDPPLPAEQRALITLDRGFVLSMLGRHGESAEILQEVISRLREARARGPDAGRFSLAEQSALWNGAICAGRAGRVADQTRYLRELVGVSEASLRQVPEERALRTHVLLLGAAMLADVESSAGNRAESRAVARRGVELARSGLAAAPDDRPLQGDLVEMALRAARATDDPTELDADRGTIAEAIALAEQAAAEEPAVFGNIHRLFAVLREQARMQSLRGDHAGARATRARMRRELVPWLASAELGEMVAAWSTNAAIDASGDAWREGDGPGTIALIEEALGTAPPSLRGEVLAALAHAAIALGDEDRGRAAAVEALGHPAAADKARAALARLTP